MADTRLKTTTSRWKINLRCTRINTDDEGKMETGNGSRENGEWEKKLLNLKILRFGNRELIS